MKNNKESIRILESVILSKPETYVWYLNDIKDEYNKKVTSSHTKTLQEMALLLRQLRKFYKYTRHHKKTSHIFIRRKKHEQYKIQ